MVDNPLARFDPLVPTMWDESVFGVDKQVLHELLLALKEELDALSRGSGAAVEEAGLGDRGLEQLERMLEQQNFSHTMLDRSAQNIERTAAVLHNTYRRSSAVEFAEAEAAKAARAKGLPVSAMIQPPPLNALSRDDSIAEQFASLSVRSSSFTMELLEVLRWLERRRAQDRDAIDLDREQVLLRAERNDPPPEAQAEMAQTARAAAEGEVAQRARGLLARGLKARGLLERVPERVPTAEELAEMGVEAAVADESSACAGPATVLSALDELESSTVATLCSFQERLRKLRRIESDAMRGELAGVEVQLGALAGGEHDGDADCTDALDELRRTVAQLRLELERLAAKEVVASADGAEDGVELSPDSEILDLLAQSSQNQASLAELQRSATKLEASATDDL
jgi:hypothetical protein